MRNLTTVLLSMAVLAGNGHAAGAQRFRNVILMVPDGCGSTHITTARWYKGSPLALDRMAQVLRDWSCTVFLLIAGGSSVLAGDPPPGTPGWSCGLGEDDSNCRYWLANASLSGSGLAVKGRHIVDPRTGQPAERLNRTWALCDSAAESDALSTACMVLSEPEINEILAVEKSWLVFLQDKENARPLGNRALPKPA